MNELWPPPSGTVGLNSQDTIKQGQCLKPILWNNKNMVSEGTTANHKHTTKWKEDATITVRIVKENN